MEPIQGPGIGQSHEPLARPAFPTIGLALSGGGVRAGVFHLGVLDALAQRGLLERVTMLSTVSGGSLVVGLVYTLARDRWPGSSAYLQAVSPAARRLLTEVDLEHEFLVQAAMKPWLFFRGGAHVVAESVKRRWGVRCQLRDVPAAPRWIINATTYETGKNWRFMPQRMGDYAAAYAEQPRILLAEAMAASAAYPGLIGPLVVETSDHTWFRFLEGPGQGTEPTTPAHARFHLWDGGVYDNLGVEALFKPGGTRYRDEYEFLIVSDASAQPAPPSRLLHRRAFHLVGIAMDQVRSLRARALVEHFSAHPETGLYLRLGNTARTIFLRSTRAQDTWESLANRCLADIEVDAVARFPTRLRRLTPQEFDRLYRHGREVLDCTLLAYGENLLQRCPPLQVAAPRPASSSL